MTRPCSTEGVDTGLPGPVHTDHVAGRTSVEGLDRDNKEVMTIIIFVFIILCINEQKKLQMIPIFFCCDDNLKYLSRVEN